MLLDTRILADMSAHTSPATAADLVAFFITESRCQVDTLTRFAGAHDFDATRRTAHSIKSSAGQFGALDLQDAARRIEDAAVRLPDHLPALTEELCQIAARTFAALEHWLAAAPQA